MTDYSKLIKKIFSCCFTLLLCITLSSCLIMATADALNDNIPKDYWEQQITDGDIESKYSKWGSYEITSQTYESPVNEGKQKRKVFVCYPEKEGKYPLVIMTNGTGVPYNKYNQIFEHLASWGYVVAGNDFEYSWKGACTSATLEFILSKPELSKYIDEEKIAVGGHSQGGLGTINAITQFENGSKYKACFSLSPTSQPLSINLGWTYKIDERTAYDLSKLKIPTLMIAGTERFDAETVCPLNELQANFNAITDTDIVIARRKGSDHGDMLWRSDPYVTAWLDLYLKGIEENRKAFFGEDSEMAKNKYWCDYEYKQVSAAAH